MGRRFFIALGSGRYCHLSQDEQLGSVTGDISVMTELFAAFGYQPVLPGLGEYDGADQIRQKLRHWSADTVLTGDDVVVLYFAGHGAVEAHDRHYLFCWDSAPDDLAATALATEDLVRILGKGELRHLLLILDTCAGGAGGAEAAAVALQRLAYRNTGSADAGGLAASAGLWFLASARRKDIAQDGGFVTALSEAVTTTTGRTGQRQQYLDLTELVKAVNERFEADGLGQRAELASGLVTGLAPFLPNSGYHPELPPIGTDLEIQRRVAERDLTEHFGPRSRGVEFESEQGLYFSGRVTVLTELVDWLTAKDGDGRGRIVTGSPGCGKSAVLGRIVALADGRYRSRLNLSGVDPATVVPEGCVAAAVHARHKRLEEVVERIGSALGTQADGAAALLQELTRRGRQGPPLVIVVDAVDEAGSDTAADAGGHGEPRRISRELLRPMSEIQGVRLLVGTRHELVGPLGPTFGHMDLDRSEYRAGDEDVAGYVTRVLLAAEEPEIRTPYRGLPDLAGTVARGVAAKAAGVYLYARTTARTLRSDLAPVDVRGPGWAEKLPSEIGGAFDDYLERFGTDEPRVRRMLLALAFSEGKGLPRGRVWTELSSVISGVPCTEADVSWALDVAEAYIAEVIDDDRRSAYRLYHKALAEHLRATADRPSEDIQRSVVEALVSLVPVSADGRPDWFAAVPYVRQHLATHAAAAGMLSGLMEDPGFLLACEPLALLRAFVSVEGAEARRIRGAYEQVAHRLTADRPLGERAADLQLSARRCEADQLADRIGGLGVSMPWSASWAWWSTSGVHRLLSGHTKAIQCTAVGELDGRPVAVTGSVDGTALVWDLVSQRKIGEALPVGVAVSAIAIGDLGDYTVVLTGGEDGSVRIWDLSAGQEYGRPLIGHTNRVKSIAVGTLGDHPVVLTASADGTARIWDLGSRKQLGKALSAHRRTVNDADLGELDGRPVAITGGDDQAVYVWDLSGLLDGGDARVDGSPLLGSAGAVSAVSVARRGNRTVALVGDSTGLLSCWDLRDRRQLGEPVAAHNSYTASGVYSVVTGQFKDRAVVLTCGAEDVRLWDLDSLQQIGQPLRGHVEFITAAALVDRADASLAVTVSWDRTARIWDLTTEQPEEGHIREVAEMAFCDVQGRPMLITGAEDGTARFWDLRTRHQAGPPMEGHSGAVQAVALHTSGGGRVIAATGGADTTVRLWNPFSGQALGVLTGHTNVVTCVAVGELDGEPVVVSGSEDGTVRIWGAASGAPLGPPIAGHIGGVRHLALRQTGPNLEIVLATSSGHCYYREVADLGRHAHLSLQDYTPSASAVGVAFHGDRPVVLCSLEGNNVHMLDVTSMSMVAGPFHGHTESVVSSALGRVGGKAVVATKSEDHTVRLWDLMTASILGPPLEGDNLFADAAPVFGQVDAVPVTVVAHRRVVRIWDVASARPLGEPLCGVDWSVRSVSIFRSAAGHDAVAVEGYDGVIRTHDLNDGLQVADPVTAMASFGHGMTTAPGLKGNVLVRGGWLGTEVWSLEDRKRIATRPGSSMGPRLHTMDGRNVVVSVGGDYELHAWDLETQIPVCKTMTGHTATVMTVRTWAFEGAELAASASVDGTVRLWDLRTGLPWGEPLPGHEGGAFAIEIARLDRDILVSGAGDGRLRFWDLADRRDTGVELDTFPSSVTAIRVAHIGGGPILVAGDRYGQMRLWDTRSPRWNLALDIGSGIRDIALDENGRVCVATDMGVVALRVNAAGQTKELSAE
ncbi:caspase family protein [Streptomyces sp. NBC_00872]|uniref:caspase family protein n=1 Tax=Streptomyces sp. NBC_00872 TaxID=2903686 RepID=UPI003863DDB3|nr:caspase family protein [Streptomyces sp. NBC_00872]